MEVISSLLCGIGEMESAILYPVLVSTFLTGCWKIRGYRRTTKIIQKLKKMSYSERFKALNLQKADWEVTWLQYVSTVIEAEGSKGLFKSSRTGCNKDQWLENEAR